MALTYTKKWLETFFEEKDLPYQSWEIEVEGTVHFIDSEVVTEAILNASPGEQNQIGSRLAQIDFRNGDCLHFLRYLAEAMIRTQTGVGGEIKQK